MIMHLNLYDKVHLVSVDTSASMQRYFEDRLKLFISSDKFDHTRADVLIRPISLNHPLLAKIEKLNPHQNKIFLNNKGITSVYFFNRKKLDYIIVFDLQVQFYYIPTKTIHKRIDSIINFCIAVPLAKKNSFISYGSVLVKQDRCLLLLGAPMTGKTMTSLSLLSNGWDFISDNKYLLSDGQAFLWENTIALRPKFHLKQFPALQNNEPLSPNVGRKFKFKSWLIEHAYRYLPRQLLPLLDEYAAFRQYHKVQIDRIFPQVRLIERAKITDVLLLSHGEKLKVQPCRLDQCIDEVTVIQKMLIRDLSEFTDLLFLSNKQLSIDARKILANNLSGARFHRMTTTLTANRKQVNSELKQYLESLEPVQE